MLCRVCEMEKGSISMLGEIVKSKKDVTPYETEKGSMCGVTPFLDFIIVKNSGVTSFYAIFLLNKLPNLIRISIIYSSCERAQRADHFGYNISKKNFLSLTSFFQNTAVQLVRL